MIINNNNTTKQIDLKSTLDFFVQTWIADLSDEITLYSNLYRQFLNSLGFTNLPAFDEFESANIMGLDDDDFEYEIIQDLDQYCFMDQINHMGSIDIFKKDVSNYLRFLGEENYQRWIYKVH